MDKEDEIKVVVCDSCLTACCWQGLFYLGSDGKIYSPPEKQS